MGIKIDLAGDGREGRRWYPAEGLDLTSLADVPEGAGESFWAEARPTDPLAGLTPAEYGPRARQRGDDALRRLADEIQRGIGLDRPLAGAAVFHQLRHHRPVDPAPLLSSWHAAMERATSSTGRYPWPLALDDRALLQHVAILEMSELLLELADSPEDPLATVARTILDKLRPTLEDHLAECILANEPRSDVRALWLLTLHPRTLDANAFLAVAIATRYGSLARRTAGLVQTMRFPSEGTPLVTATAMLGASLWALGLYPSLMAGILRTVRLRRGDDGSWSDGRDDSDLLGTLAASSLLIGLDPTFDPAPTIEWIARKQHRDGLWRQADREAPWLTSAVIDWLERAERPFIERFAWPAVPKVQRDRRTGIARYEYLVDLGHALATLTELGRLPTEVAFVDLAHFGAFNTREGQEAGDLALHCFVDALAAALPFARLIRDGGDEFIVLGPPGGSGLEDAIRAFCASWPETFRARFGPDVPLVLPRFVVASDAAGNIMEVRERLGIRIGELKKTVEPDPALGGSIDH